MAAMTANEMIPAVGQLVLVRMEQVTVQCQVMNVKHVYGRTRLQIHPVCGTGLQWVECDRVTVVPAVNVPGTSPSQYMDEWNRTIKRLQRTERTGDDNA